MRIAGWPFGIFSKGSFFKEKVFSKASCSHPSSPRMCCSSFTLSRSFLWCNEAPVWIAGMDLDRVTDPKWWQACGLEALHCPWSTMYLPSYKFRKIYFFSWFSVLLWLFLPGVAPTFPHCLLFISKLKCLQMIALLVSSDAKPKCHFGCQVLLHMAMVHPRSECSWVIEHLTAAAVEHTTSYLRKTPILLVISLILITHQ